jgi:Na+-transporting NADH:ubiquinone oxidoreductase subunit C
VDALSGATFTTKGVENMIRYWMGDGGFGPYLKKLKAGAV